MEENNLKEPGASSENMPAWREVFLYFLMLGFINIGGPVAQITMMFNHMVERRAWLSKERFVKHHGVLPYASWSGGASARNLCWLYQARGVGRYRRLA